MRRALPWILLTLVVLGVLHPLLTYGQVEGEDVDEPTTITRYDAVFDVDDSGDLDVVETLEVDFPEDDRHGVFRFFDEVDPNAPHSRRVPTVTTVTRDGRPEPYTWESEGGGRYHVLKVGDADVTLPTGTHTYVLRYRMAGVLSAPASGDGSRFRWDVVPGGWAQAIDEARLTVRLPDEPKAVACTVVPAENANSACAVTGEGTSTLLLKARGLDPRTRITLDAALPNAAPSDAELAWSPRAARIVGTEPLYVAVVAAGVVYAGWLGRRLASRTFEEPVGEQARYEPPVGVGPHQALYLAGEGVPDEAFVASLLLAAERGAVRLERAVDESWTVVPVDGTVDLDVVTCGVLVKLGVLDGSGAAGQALTVHPDDAETGRLLQQVRSDAVKETRAWAVETGHVTLSGVNRLGVFGVLAGFAVSVALMVWGTPSTSLALIPGVYAAMGVPMLFPGATTVRSESGRRVWAQVVGFRQVLAGSDGRPFDFAGREQLHSAYLPWVAAFGCGDAWDLTFAEETGNVVPTPLWVDGYHFGADSTANTLVRDFDWSVSGAVEGYESTLSGSAGSSGGSMSGSGGGGGGSW